MAGAEPSETIDFIRELAKENNVKLVDRQELASLILRRGQQK